MAHLRSTVIAKTDIAGFSSRTQALSGAELSTLLLDHTQLFSAIIASHEGTVVKGEGDAFWIIFPSVTSAALAVLEMHQALRDAQSGRGDHERLAIHAAITLGDVLHQGSDVFGDSVNLAARIDGMTPQDQTYLSNAAWLALNKAELQTSFVGEFSLKGMAEPEKIYKLEQNHQTRVFHDQVIVYIDVKGFTAYRNQNTVAAIERTLLTIEGLHKDICQHYGGTIRLFAGDSYCLTFVDAAQALAAIESLYQHWERFKRASHMPCGLGASLHKGTMNIFRSWVYSQDTDHVFRVASVDSEINPDRSLSSALATQSIREEVIGTEWEAKLTRLAAPSHLTDRARQFIQDHELYQVMLDIQP